MPVRSPTNPIWRVVSFQIKRRPCVFFPAAPTVVSLGRPYKATVMMYLGGGSDSANMLVPLSNCAVAGRDMFAEYTEARGPMALAASRLLPIAVAPNTQPCDTFGVHHYLAGIKAMYDGGEVSFIANMGNLIEREFAVDHDDSPMPRPNTFVDAAMDKAQFRLKSRQVPQGLFGHNTQVKQAQSVHAQHPGANGVLGRIVDALTSQTAPFKSQAFSINGNAKAVQGNSAPVFVHVRRGISEMNQYGDVGHHYLNMSHMESASYFADTWGSSLTQSLLNSREIGQTYSTQAALTGPAFPSSSDVGGFAAKNTINQLEVVAKMMSIRALTGNERELYYVYMPGFDTHQDTVRFVVDVFVSLCSMSLSLVPMIFLSTEFGFVPMIFWVLSARHVWLSDETNRPSGRCIQGRDGCAGYLG